MRVLINCLLVELCAELLRLPVELCAKILQLQINQRAVPPRSMLQANPMGLTIENLGVQNSFVLGESFMLLGELIVLKWNTKRHTIKVTSRDSQSVGSSPLPRVTQGQWIPIAGLHPLPCTAP